MIPVPVPNLNISALKLKHYEMKNPEFFVTMYREDNVLALFAMSEGERETLSVNLADYNLAPGWNHIFVKDYAQDEGLADEMERVGLAVKISPVVFGFGRGWLMELRFDAEALLAGMSG
jgi:hypothetical protein